MIRMIIFGIASMLQNYIVNYINEFYVKPKINRHIVVLIYTLALIFHTCITEKNSVYVIYKTYMVLILQLLLLFILYKGKCIKKLIAFFEINVIMLISDILVTQIGIGLSEIDLRSIAGAFSYQRIVGAVMCCFVQLPIIYFMRKIYKEIVKFSFAKSQWLLIFSILLTQMFSFLDYDLVFFVNEIYVGNIIFVFVICSIVFDIYMFRIIVMLQFKNDTEERIDNIAKQNIIIMDYYKDLSQTINSLSELKENYESKLKQVYKQLGKEYESKTCTDEFKNIRCENVVVDNIITSVCFDLKRMGCVYDININIPDAIQIEAIDLSSVFINLFDNALYAIEKYITECKYKSKSCDENHEYHLVAHADYRDGNLNIEVKNVKSKSQSVRRLNDIFITTKENKEAHGYGMQIIKRIAEKYCGTMTVEYDSTYFINRVILKV